MYIYMYIYVYVCICIYMYMYIYMYIWFSSDYEQYTWYILGNNIARYLNSPNDCGKTRLVIRNKNTVAATMDIVQLMSSLNYKQNSQ